MSDTVPLLPIVIDAIHSGQFECLGDGLLYEGVQREQPNTLKDLLVPTKTSKRTPIEDKERPKKWWKAQCLHYGITVPSQSTISTYRVHLENSIRQRGGIKRPQNLSDLEFEQNTKFRRLNAELRDATRRPETKVPIAKARAKKPEAEPQAPKPKAKEPKTKPEPKSKSKPAEPDVNPIPRPKQTAKKRKAETVVHVYHYDGNVAQPSSSVAPAPAREETEETKRPKKRARKAAPLREHVSEDPPPTYSEFDERPSSSQLSTSRKAVQTGIPGGFSGTYELDCDLQDEYMPKATLEVFMAKNGRPVFKALFTLPGSITCLLRLKPGTQPEDGYVRFEWCGEEAKGMVYPPSPGNVGWLKMHKSEGRVKGMINAFGALNFKGLRVDDGPPTIEEDWEDFS